MPAAASSSLFASTRRVAAHSRTSEHHAASAAFSARMDPERDDVWSLVLAKFGRRRRIDFDLPAAAAACLHPCRRNGGNASTDLVAAAADSSNHGPATTTSSSSPLLPLRRGDGFQHRSTAANGGVHTADKCAASAVEDLEVEGEAVVALRVAVQVADEKKLRQDQVKELSARLKEAEEEQRKKEDVLRQREDQVLLDRLLLRERRVKQEEAAAERSRRILEPRLHRSNSHDGIPGTTGCAAHQKIVQTLYGANISPELILPLLQCSQLSAATPVVPTENPTVPSVTALPTATPKAEDDIWNKRQIGYIFYLGLAVGLLILVRPLLPDSIDRGLLAGFAFTWGLGSVRLPFGIFGTKRWENNMSRHIGRFISLCFSLMVISAPYLLAVQPKDAASGSTAHPSPAPAPELGVNDHILLWRFIFGAIAVLVTIGHIVSWCMGYHTGGDRDLEPQEPRNEIS